MASRPEDTTSSEAARQGLLQAQAQKMQEGMPVGPEGTMPPSARGALILAAQKRAQDMQAQQVPQQLSAPPMPPEPMAQPQAAPPMPGAEPQMDPMANQQNRWAEIMRRLQGQQQALGQPAQAPPQQGMM